jgi:undecaprenyl diphosphate synthase
MTAPGGANEAACREADIPPERLPRSVAIIMDGNGRWARQRSLPRSAGHAEGAKSVRKIVTEATRLGVEALTLYSFSIENWSRPPGEVNTLMGLYAEYLVAERPTIMNHNVRVRHLGVREGLPQRVLDELDRTVEMSGSNTGMTLCLALNYGGRREIIEAVRSLAVDAASGSLDPAEISPETLSDRLDTAGLPDPDLLIRTAGEMRISNFLLWQVSYAEFYVTQTQWPDFDEAAFQQALRDYANRHRRFGGVDASNR